MEDGVMQAAAAAVVAAEACDSFVL